MILTLLALLVYMNTSDNGDMSLRGGAGREEVRGLRGKKKREIKSGERIFK